MTIMSKAQILIPELGYLQKESKNAYYLSRGEDELYSFPLIYFYITYLD